MDLDKHVAIVTGGGRGIGRATALELASMGATIVVAEFDAANGQRTADEVAKLGRPSLAIATQAVLPTMIAQHRGNIVSLASMAGKIGSRTNLPYNVSKAAVISMTKSLALAHAADGIRANCVCPGFVETDMWDKVSRDQGALLGMSPAEFTKARLNSVPLGRMETPEDVANVIGFLASPKSAYMTGQALSVDGGLVMH